MPRPIKTLLFSTLFPSSVRPVHGIFVETRLCELLKTGAVETKVVAPVPWFPFSGQRFGEYGQFAATPRFEHRNGIEVYHPRYFLPPRIGMNIAPDTLARGAIPIIKKLIANGFDFDLIDAHYYYPDGVAAGLIARQLGKPLVVTARGTDLNLIPSYPRPRQRILETSQQAAGSIGVCKALMDQLTALGADASKLHVMRNGVDLERFQPIDRAVARQHLQLENRRLLLSVGHLVERKGHHLAIEALSFLPSDTSLVIAGCGPERASLTEAVRRLGLGDRVHFAGQIPNDQLKWWYSAADALVLASSREGWANVLLESMACGTPVIATNIWGTPEVVSSAVAGCLMESRTPEALSRAVQKLFDTYPERSAVRKYAEQFSWEPTTQSQLALFATILARRTTATEVERTT